MTDLDVLRALLKRAYDDGFNKGNGMDGGCRPDDHGDFDEFWDGIGSGNIASALAAMLDTAEPPPLPDLQPGVQIPFRQGDFVVTTISANGSRMRVEMQDFVSYERDHMIQAVPSAYPIPNIVERMRKNPPATPPTPEELHTGKTCGCDGPPHQWSKGWCPDSGPRFGNRQQ